MDVKGVFDYVLKINLLKKMIKLGIDSNLI